MERFTAKRIEIVGPLIGKDPLIIINGNGKWVDSGTIAELNAEKVQKFLDKLTGNRIKEFLQGANIPTGEEKGIRVTLGDDKSDKKRQLVFWKSGEKAAKDGKLWARDLQSKRKEAFLVDSSVKDELPWDRNFFKK